MQKLVRLYARWLASGVGEREMPVSVGLLIFCPIAVLAATVIAIPGWEALHHGVPFDGSFTYLNGGGRYGPPKLAIYPMKPILTTDVIVTLIGVPLFFSALAFVLGWFGREEWRNN